MLLLERYGWKVYYKTNLLFFNEEMVVDNSTYELTEEKEAEFKTIVNSKIKEFLDNQAVTRQVKQELKYNHESEEHNAKYSISKNKVYDKYDKQRFAPISNPCKCFKYRPNYVENQKLLSDLLINLDN